MAILKDYKYTIYITDKTDKSYKNAYIKDLEGASIFLRKYGLKFTFPKNSYKIMAEGFNTIVSKYDIMISRYYSEGVYDTCLESLEKVKINTTIPYTLRLVFLKYIDTDILDTNMTTSLYIKDSKVYDRINHNHITGEIRYVRILESYPNDKLALEFAEQKIITNYLENIEDYITCDLNIYNNGRLVSTIDIINLYSNSFLVKSASKV
jgi:hypothetical protein